MYEGYVEQMEHATNAKERKSIIEEMCRIFAFSQAKAYKVLGEHGWESGRKKRHDAGESTVTSETLTAIAALLQNSIRKNGKQTMSIATARSILLQNGFDIGLSAGRIAGLLKENSLSPQQLKKPSAHIRMRTEFPNQVHQCDPSFSLLYFAPGGFARMVRDDEQYKNKDFFKDKTKCLRYVLTDHYSSSICVRYYAAMGETAQNMYDFLLYAWGQKKDAVYAFHGLPETLVWDCGSANISKPVTKALTALRVKTIPHLPGNPRAKGQVEKANNIVECQFESLLKLEKVRSVEELNDAVERWCAAFNANMMEHRSTTLARNGKSVGSRLEIWNRIKVAQLKELPNADICRQIFTTGIQVRKIGGDLSIAVFHPKVKTSLRYSVAELPSVLVGMDVSVQPILVDAEPLVLVSYELAGVIVRFELKPIEYDDVGFDVAAPVFGQSYQSQSETARETSVKKLAQMALEGGSNKVAFASITNGNGLIAHSGINPQNRFATHMTGVPVEVASVQMSEIFVSHVEAVKRIKARIGFVPDGLMSQLKTQYPDAVPLKGIDDLALSYMEGRASNAKFA